MKSTELRLGNYFNPIDRSNEVHLPLTGFIFKVLKIGIFDVEAIQFDKHPAQVEKYQLFSTNDLSPIPLSEDWLVKLGFRVFPWGWVKKESEDIGVLIKFYTKPNLRGWLEVGNGLRAEFLYVHQLQNLYFALTGIELC